MRSAVLLGFLLLSLTAELIAGGLGIVYEMSHFAATFYAIIIGIYMIMDGIEWINKL